MLILWENPVEINIWLIKESISLIWRTLKRQWVLIEEGVSLTVELFKLMLNWSVEVRYNTKESINEIWRRSPKKLGVWIKEGILLEVEF